MTLGKIENLESIINVLEYDYIFKIEKAVKESKSNSGEWISDEETDIKAIFLTESNFTTNIFELHKQNKNLQYVIKGIDVLYLSDCSVCQKNREYSDTEDYSLYEGKELGRIEVLSNHFYLIKTNELHPSSLKENSGKIVFKIKDDRNE